jgi:hypothetical protein
MLTVTAHPSLVKGSMSHIKTTALVAAILALPCTSPAAASGIFRGTFGSAVPFSAGDGYISSSFALAGDQDPEPYWIAQGSIGVSNHLALSGFWAEASNDSETDFWSLSARVPFGDPNDIGAALFTTLFSGADDLDRGNGNRIALVGVALHTRRGRCDFDGAFPLYIQRFDDANTDCESGYCDIHAIPAPISLIASEVWITCHVNDNNAIRFNARIPFPSVQYEANIGRILFRCTTGFKLYGMMEFGVTF